MLGAAATFGAGATLVVPGALTTAGDAPAGAALSAARAAGVKWAGGASCDLRGSRVGINGSARRGSSRVTPDELLARISGVIITTSSVRFFCAALLLNS